MLIFTTPAVILRRIEYGDYDLILSFFTLHKGKISVIAKSAKKSVKRFSGVLEPFSLVRIVCRAGRPNTMPILQEATIERSSVGIGSDVDKTAYAGYWAEIVHEYTEEGVALPSVYELLTYALEALDCENSPPEFLNLLFQLRFLTLSGLGPNLTRCGNCRTPMHLLKQSNIRFDPAQGGLVCRRCSPGKTGPLTLSIDTIKQLEWMTHGDFQKAGRIRLTSRAINQGHNCLESFVEFCLGKKIRSLSFLRQVRKEK